MNKETIELLNNIALELENQAVFYNKQALEKAKDSEMLAIAITTSTAVCHSLAASLRRVAGSD